MRKILSVFYPTTSFEDCPEVERTLELLAKGFIVSNVPPLNATDSKRDGFLRYIAQTDCDILMAWRGGQITLDGNTERSSIELVEALTISDWDTIKASQVKICGYSDVTFLLCALVNHGIECYYGPNFQTTLLKSDESDCKTTVEYMLAALYNEEGYTINWTDKKLSNDGSTPLTINSGVASGRLIGGNLTTLYDLAQRYPKEMPKRMDGDIILIEENEADYFVGSDSKIAGLQREKISALSNCGFLKDIGGLLIGRTKVARQSGFIDDKWGITNNLTEGKYTASILHELNLDKLPVLANVSCSHIHPMVTLPLGRTVTLDASNQKLIVHARASSNDR